MPKLNKIIVFLFVFALFYIFIPYHFVLAGETSDWTISFSWNGTAVSNGGQYDFPLNTQGYGDYSWPGGNAYGEVYKGTLHNAIQVNGHYLGYGGHMPGQNDWWPDYGHYFVVIHSIGPWDDIPSIVDWFETGIGSIPDHWGMIEFDVGESVGVPLYTQVRSQYPSFQETESWLNEPYGKGILGNYSCGSTIASCGCAITSIVMVARNYGITETNGKNVDPLEINSWLNGEPSGYVNGSVNWIAAAKYTGWRIKYEQSDSITNNYALLDEKLNNRQPVIAKANSDRGGINKEHFFVIDNKLSSTYAVKDPAWYETKNLNEGFNDENQHIRNYENGFDGLRIYKQGNGIAQSAITLVLGSPAELLITDPQDRKLGKDQNGAEYNEIPQGWYFEEGYDDPTGENPPSQEKNKIIQILEPLDGEYKVEVIGTGTGNYSLDSNVYDNAGNPHTQTLTGDTQPNLITNYILNFITDNPEEIIIRPIDQTPPEAKIYFDKDNETIKVEGTDDITQNPAVSIIEDSKEQVVYEIEDEAQNTTKIFFSKLNQSGKEIKTELKSIQYNDDPIINFSKTDLKYEWSLDKKTDQIKELEQKIKSKDTFDIHAKYNKEKDETEIKLKSEEKQTLSGLVIIKLMTESGLLDFEF